MPFPALKASFIAWWWLCGLVIWGTELIARCFSLVSSPLTLSLSSGSFVGHFCTVSHASRSSPVDTCASTATVTVVADSYGWLPACQSFCKSRVCCHSIPETTIGGSDTVTVGTSIICMRKATRTNGRIWMSLLVKVWQAEPETLSILL